MIALEHQIFEGDSDKPILEHVFYGETMADVLAIVSAHMRFDEFFRAAQTTQVFRGIKLRVRERWIDANGRDL
jgi:hypothetical protein